MARSFSGQRLREMRVAARLRSEQLAVAIERSVYSVHEYERGRVTPPTDVLVRLASVLDSRIEDFFADDDAETAPELPRTRDEYVRRAVAGAPTLTQAQRDGLALLLGDRVPT